MGMEEENAAAAEETELKSNVGADKGIEDHFDEERNAEEVESCCLPANEFADEIELRGEPAALDSGEGADKEKIAIDCDEQEDDFPAGREKET